MEREVLKLKAELAEIMRPTKELRHGEETLAWLLKIDPNACWQLQIAAFAHDIERAVPYIEGMTPNKPLRTESKSYDEYKSAHARRSAIIVGHIMDTLGFALPDIAKVTNAIRKHEVGGDNGSDLVRDADSIRWFDSGYIDYIKCFGLESACEKGWWMYKRATESTKALIDSLPYNESVKAHITRKGS